MFPVVRTIVAAFCVGAALTGCTVKVGSTDPVLGKDAVEKSIADNLQKSVGQRPDAVECPGPITAKVGQSARCTLTDGTTKYGLTVTVTAYKDGTASYDVQVDNQPLAG